MEFQSPYPVTSSEDLKITEYHLRRLTYAFWNLNAISGFLFLENEPVFRLGDAEKQNSILRQILHNLEALERESQEMIPTEIGNWDEEGVLHQAILIRFPHKELFVFAVIVQKGNEELPRNKWKQLSNSVLTYLSVGISKQEKTLLSFRSFTEVFRTKMEASLEETGAGVLALFYLQDLSPFFKPLGIVKSREILREVSSTLQAMAKEGELFFQMNLRSFYLFCPGETMEHANKRLEGLYFPSKHMILDYKLQLFPVSLEVVQDLNQFSSLFMENF
ncbi:hypothetical protein [Leptospira sp. 'Mane']|uniref:hypothetical protein n=1 Tax=Leptospira sp. 'Mane' TaxID=3387407 RepID=UPI00398B4C3F